MYPYNDRVYYSQSINTKVKYEKTYNFNLFIRMKINLDEKCDKPY